MDLTEKEIKERIRRIREFNEMVLMFGQEDYLQHMKNVIEDCSKIKGVRGGYLSNVDTDIKVKPSEEIHKKHSKQKNI